jgi:hypothetical protein
MFSLREFVNVGVFMSYGASFTAMFRRAPEYVRGEQSQPTFRSSSQPSSSWSSILMVALARLSRVGRDAR